jgi:hypothetical protein
LAQGAKWAAVNIANFHKVRDNAMGQNSRQPKRVSATTAAHFVGRLAHIRDMSCATLRVINPFWLQRTRGSLC